MERTILHCDCNAFYASVETLLDPTLADGPSAVCGDPESRHGIILAKNEQAKACGVQTAETIWQAKRKCPSLRLVAPHREEYVKYSRRCNELYLQYTDLVDPFGIDESFLDVTGSMHLFGTGAEIADTLRFCQAGQRLQKAGCHDRILPQKLPRTGLAAAGQCAAVCRQANFGAAQSSGRADDRRPGRL